MRLSFKREFVDPILQERKTQTIRGRSYGLKPGDRVDAICRYNEPPFARLEVVGISKLSTAEVAREWPGVRETYDQDEVYRISFRRLAV